MGSMRDRLDVLGRRDMLGIACANVANLQLARAAAMQVPNVITCARFAPDGRKIVAGGWFDHGLLWEAATPEQVVNACYAAGFRTVHRGVIGDELVAAEYLSLWRDKGWGTLIRSTDPVVVETVRSTDVQVPPRAYYESLRRACDRHGALLVFDEIDAGIGGAVLSIGFLTWCNVRMHDAIGTAAAIDRNGCSNCTWLTRTVPPRASALR